MKSEKNIENQTGFAWVTERTNYVGHDGEERKVLYAGYMKEWYLQGLWFRSCCRRQLRKRLRVHWCPPCLVSSSARDPWCQEKMTLCPRWTGTDWCWHRRRQIPWSAIARSPHLEITSKKLLEYTTLASEMCSVLEAESEKIGWVLNWALPPWLRRP